MRLRRAWRRIRARGGTEDGYTMIAVIGAISLVSMLAAATLAATNGDINLVKYDLDHRRAHAAAQAGIADYSFHLNNDNSYWARCTSVPSPPENPTAVNQKGAVPLKKRTVPGTTDASYAVELLPASTNTEATKKCNTAKPVESMLEQGAANPGSFRIRSTGFAGKAKVSIVATYKRASLLDYVYFTQFETSDPVTYGKQAWLSNAYAHCTKFIREERQKSAIPGSGGQYCDKIVFTSGDDLDGPVHTNDALVISGNPSFGETAADITEVGAPKPGWFACSAILPNTSCKTASPTFVGPFATTAPVLKPPATNSDLEDIAGSEYTYSCMTRLQLEGTKIKVTTNSGSNKVTTKTVDSPSSGVIYVKQGACAGSKWPECSAEYTPFQAKYPDIAAAEGSDCGNVYVNGTTSKELTIAAERDIIIYDDVTKSGQGLLGLIANNFVRVRHPFSDTDDTARFDCGSGSNQSGSQQDLKIEAAILAIDHSFIVDHYDCGDDLGTLTVNGAISQKYRGAVGSDSNGGTGYIKNYNYDKRLRYMEPPHFLNPIEPSWHIQRETLDFSG